MGQFGMRGFWWDLRKIPRVRKNIQVINVGVVDHDESVEGG